MLLRCKVANKMALETFGFRIVYVQGLTMMVGQPLVSLPVEIAKLVYPWLEEGGAIFLGTPR